MDDASTAELKRVIQSQHGVAASFAKSVKVLRGAKPAEWDGLVHIFDLKNHPSAVRAFAWSSPIAGGQKPRFFAVLQSGQIATPVQAVKAASAAIRKWGAKGVGKL
jgi:hypothetical protein